MQRIKIHGGSCSSVFEIDSFDLVYDSDSSCLGTITLRQKDKVCVLRGQFAGPGGAFTKNPDEIFTTQHITGNLLNAEGVGIWAIGIKSAMSEVGRKGGSVKSERKAAAARINGLKGGRPRGSNKLLTMPSIVLL